MRGIHARVGLWLGWQRSGTEDGGWDTCCSLFFLFSLLCPQGMRGGGMLLAILPHQHLGLGDGLLMTPQWSQSGKKCCEGVTWIVSVALRWCHCSSVEKIQSYCPTKSTLVYCAPPRTGTYCKIWPGELSNFYFFILWWGSWRDLTIWTITAVS